MAVIKDTDTPYGVTAPYHRINQITIKQDHLDIAVYSYTSQQAWQNGSAHISENTVRIPFMLLNFDPRDLFYPLLQEYPGSFLKDSTSSIPNGVTPHSPVFTVTAPPIPTMP